MKKYLITSALLLSASLPGFTGVAKLSSYAQPSRSSQFSVNRSANSHVAANKIAAHPHGVPLAQPNSAASVSGIRISDHLVRPKNSAGRARKFSGGTTAASLAAGARTLLGGQDDGVTTAVMGDFNGDGKPDVAKIVSNVISSVTTYQVAVLLGNGNGTFQTAVVTDTDGNTDDPIIAGDLKGSGTDDIIQVHPGTGSGSSIDVMLSNGSGGFAAPVKYSVSSTTLEGGVLTDINGDGKLDLLVFDNSTPANVIALLGNGDGTFQTASILGKLTGAAPANMIFADFNGDGNIDFAGYTTSGQVQVTLASGAGAYANAPATLTTSSGLYSGCNTVAGDLTGDSKPEIITFNCTVNTVTVYVNNGSGSFAAGVDYNNNADLGQNINGGAIADVDGDGNNDIVAINSGTSDISLFLGNGDGTVAVQPLRYGLGGAAWAAPLLADFNGDGLIDVVESDDDYNLVYLQGSGAGAFQAAPVYSLPEGFNSSPHTSAVATGDFNGDGIPDVVMCTVNSGLTPGIWVYLGKGDGTFSPGVSYGSSSAQYGLAVADFNGDGNLDIASADWVAGKVQIFLGKGDGTFTVANAYPSDTVSEPGPLSLVAGDFNNNGKIDIAVANQEGNLGVLLGNGDGTFAPVVSYPVGTALKSVFAVDVNGDGFLDLEATGEVNGQYGIAILLGNSNGSGTFASPTLVTLNSGGDYAAFGDLNGDGKIDMAVDEGSVTGQIEIFLGNGDGTFAAGVLYPSSTLGSSGFTATPIDIAMADMNGDGNLDLVYLIQNRGTVAIALGNGDGTVAAPVEFPATETLAGMALADLTGNGAMDVLAGDAAAGGFSVLINNDTTTTANPDFSISTQTPSATVTPGASGTYTLTLTGTNGYNGTVTFACSNLPAGATCSSNPSSVVLNGSAPQTTTLTITTTAPTTASLAEPNPGAKPASRIFLASLAGMGLLGLALVRTGKSARRWQVNVVLALIVVSTLSTVVACSNGSKSGGTGTGTGSGGGTPAGTYLTTVTSTGTGTGAPTHTLNLTLVVQ
jgi:hypothetical protein